MCARDEEGGGVGDCAIVPLDPPDVREEVGGGIAIAINTPLAS